MVVVAASSVVVVGSRLVVVVGSSVVVVVGGSVVVVGATVVVVGSTVLTGAGGGVGSGWVVGATPGSGGGVAEGGGLAPWVAAEAAVVGSWAARATGEVPGSSGTVPAVVEDPALEGAADGGWPVAAVTPMVGVGSGAAAGSGGVGGTRAAEATIAARTAKVSPNATSIRRRGRRRWARWRGLRVGMRGRFVDVCLGS
jgi:hypothetical protein